MLNESSFYPLNPPAMDVCYDSDLASKFARLDEPPNVLILPSKEKCFIRVSSLHEIIYNFGLKLLRNCCYNSY